MTAFDAKKISHLMEQAIADSMISQTQEQMNPGGGPFGAVVAHRETYEILSEGYNRVLKYNNPLRHAEIEALNQLSPDINPADTILVTSCEPCPMCLHAIARVGIHDVIYANTKDDAAEIGFDDQALYDELLVIPEKRKIHFDLCNHEHYCTGERCAIITNADDDIIAQAKACDAHGEHPQLRTPVIVAIEHAAAALENPHLSECVLHTNYVPDYFEQSLAYWSHIFSFHLEQLQEDDIHHENCQFQSHLKRILNNDPNAPIHLSRIQDPVCCENARKAFEGFKTLRQAMAEKQGLNVMY